MEWSRNWGRCWQVCVAAAGLAVVVGAACRPAATPPNESPTVSPTASVTAPLTARFVGPDAVVSVVIRPRQILERLAAGGEAVSLYAVEAARWSFLQRGSPQHVLRIVETCGFPLHEVEEIGAVGLGSGDMVHVIRFSRPVDPDLVGDLHRRPRTREVGGVKTYRETDGMYAAAIVDDRSLLVGVASVVDALLDRAHAGGPVHAAVAGMPVDADVAAAYSGARVPRDATPAESPLAALEFAVATATFGARPRAEATAEFADAAAAARGGEAVTALVRQATTAAGGLVEAAGRSPQAPPPAAVAGLRSLAAGLAAWAAALNVQHDGRRLVMSATAPVDAGFPGDLVPLLVLPDVVAAAAAARDEPEMEEEAEALPVPTHWRRFDVAAARQRREALRANPVAVRLRNRFPAATGFDTESFLAVAGDASRPRRDLPDQPLSLLAFTGNFFGTSGVIPARDRTFVVNRPWPNEVAQAFTETLGLGYGSLIRVEDVTGVSCTVTGDTAEGVVTFESDLAAGEVPYRAVRDGDGWRFTGFDLPGWGLTCSFQPDGTRSLRSDLGPYGGEPAGHRVELLPTLDGEPLRKARLVLHGMPQLDTFDARLEDDGRFTATLPPGRYLVQVLGDDLPEPLDEALRGDGPSVTIPAEAPTAPIPVELNPAGRVREPAAAGR